MMILDTNQSHGEVKAMEKQSKTRSLSNIQFPSVGENELVQIDRNVSFSSYFASVNDKNSKKQDFVRKIEYMDPEGKLIKKTVTIPLTKIGENDYDVLNTFDYKTMSIIKHLWKCANVSYEQSVNFTVGEIIHIFDWQRGGGNYDVVVRSLNKLKLIPIIHTYEYKITGKNGELGNKRDKKVFNIINDLDLSESEIAGKDPTCACTFRLNIHVIENLINKYSDPVVLKTIIPLDNEMAIKLYNLLEKKLEHKTVYSASDKEIYNELAMNDPGYSSLRLRKLIPALKLLVGKRISTGYLKNFFYNKHAEDGKGRIITIYKVSDNPFLSKSDIDAAIVNIINKFDHTLPKFEGQLKPKTARTLLNITSLVVIFKTIDVLGYLINEKKKYIKRPVGWITDSINGKWDNNIKFEEMNTLEKKKVGIQKECVNAENEKEKLKKDQEYINKYDTIISNLSIENMKKLEGLAEDIGKKILGLPKKKINERTFKSFMRQCLHDGTFKY